MRLFISGSAPLLTETHHAFSARTGHAILERYGMTETGMITSNPYDGARVPGSVGFALPDVSVRIRGDQPGVIEVKGPNVFKGYWRMPEKTREEFTADGYFITGDVATIDAEGRVTIVGRAKDLIISGGFNVYPKEVEDVLDALPGVGGIGRRRRSASRLRRRRDRRRDRAGRGAARGRRSSPSWRKQLAKFKVPKRIIVVEELPRNAMGKVQKAELRRIYGNSFA